MQAINVIFGSSSVYLIAKLIAWQGSSASFLWFSFVCSIIEICVHYAIRYKRRLSHSQAPRGASFFGAASADTYQRIADSVGTSFDSDGDR